MKRAALGSDDRLANAQQWALRAKDLYTRLVWSALPTTGVTSQRFDESWNKTKQLQRPLPGQHLLHRQKFPSGREIKDSLWPGGGVRYAYHRHMTAPGPGG